MTEQPQRFETTVAESRKLSSDGYELILERGDLSFDAGRLITIHGSEATEDRSYTICSGEQDPMLHILYRYIPEGKLTPQLVALSPGDSIDISGPYGEFILRDPARPVFFVATGTGVAPCRAYARSYPALDLTLVHGVRFREDLYYREEFEAHDYHPCVSREESGGLPERVTEVCRDIDIDEGTQFYLCGANEMIFEVHSVLKDRGIDDSDIFTEPYYYRLDA